MEIKDTKEIKSAKEGKYASITLKLNSLSDEELILKLNDAARAGVKVKMIIRGICCMYTESKKFKKKNLDLLPLTIPKLFRADIKTCQWQS